MTRPTNYSSDHDLVNVLNSRDFQDLLENLMQSQARVPGTPPETALEALTQYLRDNYGLDEDSDSDDSIELQRISTAEEDAYADRLLQALMNGQREMAARRFLPTTPPPSPTPNPALRYPLHPPPLPPRRRSQLGTAAPTTYSNVISQQQRFMRFIDPNASEESKSPHSGFATPFSPIDRNNDLPLTSEYMQRYGRKNASILDDSPER